MKEMLGGCCVCSDENGWTDNPLIYCDGPSCEVAVHQGCYGIQEVPQGDWFCAKCDAGPSNNQTNHTNGDVHLNGSGVGLLNGGGRAKNPRCELCPSGYGALKRTEQMGWAHVICALYIPEVRFGNVHTMDPVILSDVPSERFARRCYICENAGKMAESMMGACMSCNKPSCKKGFHVTCAQQRGLLCEEDSGSKNVKYCGFCEHHMKKAAQLTTIKRIPPCRIRPPPPTPPSVLTSTTITAGSSVWTRSIPPNQPTPPGSTGSAAVMLLDPISRPEQVGLNALAPAPSEDVHLVNSVSNFSPPLTSSSRSSVALDATPPLAAGGSAQVLPPSVKSESPNGAGGSLGALTSFAMGQNHQRLGASGVSALMDVNGHGGGIHLSDNHEMKPVVDVAYGLASATPTHYACAKRSRDVKTELGENKPKRARVSNNNKKSMKQLMDAVSPMVSDTVLEIQRERVADRSAAARAAAVSAGPSTSNGTTENGGGNLLGGFGSLLGSSPTTGGRSTQLPATLEQLLEKQYDQSSQCLLNSVQGHFDLSQLLSCLHQLKSENIRLEEQLSSLSRRREHLLALNARLSSPLAAQVTSQTTSNNSCGPATATGCPPSPLHSPLPQAPSSHQMSQHTPHSYMSTSMGSVGSSNSLQQTSQEDSLSQLKSLAAGGTPRTSTSHSSLLIRAPSPLPPASSSALTNNYHQPRVSTSAVTTMTSSASTSGSLDLTGISPERLNALNPFGNLSGGLLTGRPNQGVDLMTQILLNQQLLSNPQTASLLRYLVPGMCSNNPAGASAVQPATSNSIGK